MSHDQQPSKTTQYDPVKIEDKGSITEDIARPMVSHTHFQRNTPSGIDSAACVVTRLKTREMRTTRWESPSLDEFFSPLDLIETLGHLNLDATRFHDNIVSERETSRKMQEALASEIEALRKVMAEIKDEAAMGLVLKYKFGLETDRWLLDTPLVSSKTPAVSIHCILSNSTAHACVVRILSSEIMNSTPATGIDQDNRASQAGVLQLYIANEIQRVQHLIDTTQEERKRSSARIQHKIQHINKSLNEVDHMISSLDKTLVHCDNGELDRLVTRLKGDEAIKGESSMPDQALNKVEVDRAELKFWIGFILEERNRSERVIQKWKMAAYICGSLMLLVFTLLFFSEAVHLSVQM
ncbi:hypothetical protein CVT24_005280 [Panaeolus cyanescens]|uniref:Uncharacterized protein n=1 Tax=Panaeolus cyanescens TaxID=181874 RepID=A0A409Y937_9AGAR|nr:hypothetical protein CVT24_005280 [Panaeolus cyanescens]